MEAWAVVVAGGAGTRFGQAKQWALLGGRAVVDWAVEAASLACTGVVVVVPPDSVDRACPGADVVVAGGATRSASVRAGLAAVPLSADVIVVHDAARPLARPALFTAVLDAVAAGAGAAICAIPVTDTVKRVIDGVVHETLDRTSLVAVQTPQAFVASLLRRAHAGERGATDDAALVESLGERVVVVAGDPVNRKLTGPMDLVVAEAALAAGALLTPQGAARGRP